MATSMTPVFIYTLNDPVTGIVRYCGQTVDPDERLSRHVRECKKNWHVSRWIKKLLSKNFRPVMEILDVVPDNEADFWEREYIQNFQERGFALTNMTPGGDGCGSGEENHFFGKKHKPETKAKISAALMGNIPWNKGKPGYPSSRKGRKTGKVPWNKGVKTGQISSSVFKPGHATWNKGVKTGQVSSSVFKLGNAPWNKGTKGAQIAWNKGVPGKKLSPESIVKREATRKLNREKKKICPEKI